MDDSLKGNERFFQPGNFPYRNSILETEIHDQLHFVLPTEYMQTYPRTMACFNKQDDRQHKASVHMSMLFFISEAIHNTMKYRSESKGKNFQEDGYTQQFQILMTYITKEVLDDDTETLPVEKLLHPRNTVAYLFSVLLLDPQLRIEDALADQIDINWHGPPQLKKQKNADGTEQEANPDDEVALPAIEENVPTGRLNVRNGPYTFARNQDGTWKQAPKGDRTNAKNYHKFISNCNLYAAFLRTCTGASDSELDRLLASQNYRVNFIPSDSPLHHSRAFSLENAVRKFQELGANEIFCDVEQWRKANPARFGCPSPTVGSTILYDTEEFAVQRLLEDKLPHTHVLDKSLMLKAKASRGIIVGEGANAFDLEALMHSIGFLPPSEAYEKELKENTAGDIFNTMFASLSEMHRWLITQHRVLDPYTYGKKLRKLRKQGLMLYSAQLDTNNAKLPIGYRSMLMEYNMRLSKITLKVEHFWHGGNNVLSPFSQFRVTDITFLKNGRTSTSTLMLLPKLRRAADSVYIPATEINTNKENVSLISGPGAGKSVVLIRLQNERIPGTYVEKSGGSAQGLVGSPSSERRLEVHQEANQTLAPVREPTGSDLNTLLRKLTQIGEGRDIYETTRKNPETKEREGVRYESPYTNVCIVAHNVRPAPKATDGAIAAMYNRFAQEYVQPNTDEERQRLVETVLSSDQRFDADVDHSRERSEMLQLAIMDYWGAVANHGVPLPDISLFSDLAPRALSYVYAVRKDILSQLRDLARMKIRMYCEIVRFAARMALFSVLGVNGDSATVYDRDAVLIEMSKYAYASMDMVVYVVSEALMSAINGSMYLAVLEIVKEDSNYIPLGAGPEGETLDNVKPWSDAAPPEVRATEPYNMRHHVDAHSPVFYSVQMMLAYVEQHGLNYLGLPEYTVQTRNRSEPPKTRSFQLHEVNVDPSYMEIFEINANKCKVPPLVERTKDVTFKTELITNAEGRTATYVNFNYFKVQGTIGDYTRMFNSTMFSEEMLKDTLYKLRNRMMSVPYIPVMPEEKSKAGIHDRLHSLRFSKLAIAKFKKYRVPVLISDVAGRCFYLLAAFVENKPHDLIESAIRHMCFTTTRPINCILGFPSISDPDYYAAIEIGPTKQRYTRVRASHVSDAERSIYDTVMGSTSVPEAEEDPTFQDLEEFYARRYLKENFPKNAEYWKTKTPEGIHNALYGPAGYYSHRDGLIERPYPEALRRKDQQIVVVENQAMASPRENREALRRKSPDSEVYKSPHKSRATLPGLLGTHEVL